MIDFLVNSLIVLFFIFFFYLIYFILVVFFSKNITGFIRKFKSSMLPKQNLSLIIYANEEAKQNLPSLLETIKKQKYENFQAHLILDGFDEQTSNMIEFIGGTIVYKLGTEQEPVGKDSAISMVIERLIFDKAIDTFVFLNANRQISDTFMLSANIASCDHDVVSGLTQLEIDKNSSNFINKVRLVFHNFQTRIFEFGRSQLGLATFIDSDICTIKREVIENLKCIDFKDKLSQIKYTLLLVKSGFNVTFNPCLMSYTKIQNYDFTIIPFSYKLKLFANCLPLLLGQTNKQFSELIFNLICPNILTLFFTYSSVFLFSYYYYFFWSFEIVFAFGALIILTLLSANFIARLTFKESLYLAFYPFLSLKQTLNNFNLDFSKFFTVKDKLQTEKISVNVTVTDEVNNINCILDLISEPDLSFCIFKYKNRKYTSSKFVKMYDAIKDISEKLQSHGFDMKICQNCKMFTSEIESDKNLVKGLCSRTDDQDLSQKLLWYNCKFWQKKSEDNVISLNNFKS